VKTKQSFFLLSGFKLTSGWYQFEGWWSLSERSNISDWLELGVMQVARFYELICCKWKDNLFDLTKRVQTKILTII